MGGTEMNGDRVKGEKKSGKRKRNGHHVPPFFFASIRVAFGCGESTVWDGDGIWDLPLRGCSKGECVQVECGGFV